MTELCPLLTLFFPKCWWRGMCSQYRNFFFQIWWRNMRNIYIKQIKKWSKVLIQGKPKTVKKNAWSQYIAGSAVNNIHKVSADVNNGDYNHVGVIGRVSEVWETGWAFICKNRTQMDRFKIGRWMISSISIFRNVGIKNPKKQLKEFNVMNRSH